MKLQKDFSLKKALFHFCEKFGIHVTPVSFKFPIPDTKTLKDELWQKQTELVGIDINEHKQIELLSLFSSIFKKEYEEFPKTKTDVSNQYFLNNNFFGSVDGEILYCMIRNFKPKRILEVGSGYSTYLSAQAIQKNLREDKRECVLISVEPYPNEVLKTGFSGLSKLILKEVQDVPLSEFYSLEENDILFIDSSHIVKIGSDVQFEILEVLPRLKKGVLIHFHDIFLPAEYPKSWVLEGLNFLNEQYMLQAFLAFNENFSVQWAGSYMHLKHKSKLEAAFNSYNRNKVWPGSFWIRKIK